MTQEDDDQIAPPRSDSRATETLTFRLIVLLNLITRPFNTDHGARHNITLSEWRCITWLAAVPGSSGQDTATGIGMDRMGVSRNLRSLKTKSVVSRAIDPADRKRWNWQLTERGWAIYDAIMPEAVERDKMLTENMSNAEIATMRQFLEIATRQFEEEG